MKAISYIMMLIVFQTIVITAYTEDKSASPLDKSVSFKFNKTPLAKVTTVLSQTSGIPVTIDMGPVTEGDTGSLVFSPVTLNAKNMKLENALFWITRQTGSVYKVKENGST